MRFIITVLCLTPSCPDTKVMQSWINSSDVIAKILRVIYYFLVFLV